MRKQETRNKKQETGIWILLMFAACGLAGEAATPEPIPAPPLEREAIPAPKLDDAAFQDLVFLGETGPVLMRLHVYVDGKPYQDVWEDWLAALFRFLDQDNNGVLGKEEAARVPRPETLTQVRQFGFFAFQRAAASLDELDTDKDGKVSRGELLDYYRRGNVRGIQLGQNQNFAQNANALSETLFKHLDVNNDGKLTREKLTTALSLRKLDLDDDEVITLQELGGNPFAAFAQVRGGAAAQPSSFLVLAAIANPAARSQALLPQYDKDKNQKLSRAEIGLDQESFDKLDSNNDGQLDSGELLKFFQKPPDVEVTVQLGKSAAKEPVVPLSTRYLMKDSAGGKQVTVGNARIFFARQDSSGQVSNTGRQQIIPQFKTVDKDKKGFLELKDLTTPQTQFLRQLFPIVDRNGDGKMAEAELTAFLDLQAQAQQSYASFTLGDGGQGLFELLDVNRDGRLSERELRTAWARLSVLDRERKGHVARADIPRQYQVNVLRGQALGGRFAGNVVMTRGANPVAAPAKGPLWFRKMDRNGDGDVSPREFLGSPEDFKRIDLDADGLIDIHEAAKTTEKATAQKP